MAQLKGSRVADGVSVPEERSKDTLSSPDLYLRIDDGTANLMIPAELAPPIGVEDAGFNFGYVVPYEAVFNFQKRGNGNFVMAEQDDPSLFVRQCGDVWHQKLELVDASGRVVLTLQDKIITTHNKWVAMVKGPGGKYVVVFSVEKEQVFQRSTCLNVYLGDGMSSSDGCDYKVRGSLKDRNCHIYGQGSSEAIAQIFEGASPDEFTVRINPDVDYVFVASLIVIVDAIESRGTTKGVFVKAAKKIAKVTAAVGVQAVCAAVL